MHRSCPVLALLMSVSASADSKLTRHQQLARDIYAELIAIDTTQSEGDTFKAAKAMAARLVKGGLPAADVNAFQTAPKRGNLVARLRGTGRQKPMLLVAHIDVVEARPEDWSTHPFELVEKDGYFYGRGTADDKAMAAIFVADLIRLAQDKYKPDRDLLLVLECDEEIGDRNGYGIKWLIEHQKDLLAAELAINEGAGVGTKESKPLWNGIQTAEKQAQNYWLEVTNRGGHSSLPRKDNAIYQLSEAMVKVEKFDFPLALNDTTRSYFKKMSTIETGQTAADMKSVVAAKPNPAAVARLSAQPVFNSQLRTTCVATRLDAGHADNALPQRARALINCRIIPGETVEGTQKMLETVIANSAISITPIDREAGSTLSASNAQLLAA